MCWYEEEKRKSGWRRCFMQNTKTASEGEGPRSKHAYAANEQILHYYFYAAITSLLM